jgi:hypothetical protein
VPELEQFELLTATQLAERLNLPTSWVRNQCRTRAVDPPPSLIFGKYRRYQWGHPDLVNWIEKRRAGR